MEQIVNWKNTTLNKYLKTHSVAEEVLTDIDDWFASSACRNYLPRLQKLSVPAVIALAHDWSRSFNATSALNEAEGATDFIFRSSIDPNLTWVKLVSPASYERESAMMSHCVRSYKNRTHSTIYSLRDNKNHPHCTLEVSAHHAMQNWRRFALGGALEEIEEIDKEKPVINQISGKGNSLLAPKYRQYLKEFINFLQSTMNLRNSTAYNKYGWINSAEGLVAIEEVSNFVGDLDLSSFNSNTTFNEFLTVTGNVKLSYFQGILPKYFTVEGNLNLSSLNGAMPEFLQVGGNLTLTGAKIESFSSSLSVGGKIVMYKNQFAIPEHWLHNGIEEKEKHEFRIIFGDSFRFMDSHHLFYGGWGSGRSSIHELMQAKSRVRREGQVPEVFFIGDMHSEFDFQRLGRLLNPSSPELVQRTNALLTTDPGTISVPRGLGKMKSIITPDLDRKVEERANIINWCAKRYPKGGFCDKHEIFAACFAPKLEQEIKHVLDKKPDLDNTFKLRNYQKNALAQLRTRAA